MSQSKTTKPKLPSVSFVIPAYNAGNVLADCVSSITAAMEQVVCQAWEIVIVNDGSNDDTGIVAEQQAKQAPIRIITLPENQGRFLARQSGILQAKHDWIFLLDTKALLAKDALLFLSRQHLSHPERKVWNGHVLSDIENNAIAAFNEASVMLAWGKYLRQPRLVGFGEAEFDYYPKGTTCLFLPSQLLREALQQFKTTPRMRYVSDDTRLLRYIASQTNIWLSPRFACFYRARSSLKQSIPWLYNRGILFVDSYLHTGTRFFWPLIIILIGMPLFIVLALWRPLVIALPILAWLLIIAYLKFRLPKKHWLAVLELSWLFVVIFVVGLYAGTYLRLTSRKTPVRLI